MGPHDSPLPLATLPCPQLPYCTTPGSTAAAPPTVCTPAIIAQPALPLQALLRQAQSCEELLALVQGSDACSVAELTAAVNRAVRLHQAAGQQHSVGEQTDGDAGWAAMRGLLAIAHARLPQLDAWACTQCLWAAATLQQQQQQRAAQRQRLLLAAEQQADWQQRLAALLPSATPQAVATSLWAASRLGWPLPAPAEAAIVRTARRMNAQDAALVLWAVAASRSRGWHLGGGGMASLLRRLERVLPAANSQDVSNSLWALVQLSWPADARLLVAAAVAIERTAPGMSAQAAANTVLACGSRNWRLGAGAAAALQQRLVRLLPCAPPQAVANSLEGASRLGWQLEGRLAAAAAAALRRTLPRMTSEGVAACLWAYGHGSWQLGSRTKVALGNALLRTLPLASTAQLGSMCKALGRLRWDPGPAVTAAAAAVLELRVSEASACPAAEQAPQQALRDLLWAWAELGLEPPASLLGAAAHWLAQSAGRLSALEACDVAYCLARLHSPLSGSLLDAVVARWAGGLGWGWRMLAEAGKCPVGMADLAAVLLCPPPALVTRRCMHGLESGEAGGGWLCGLVWACSEAAHSPLPAALDRLSCAGVAAVRPAWQAGDRCAAGSGILLVEGLARQVRQPPAL